MIFIGGMGCWQGGDGDETVNQAEIAATQTAQTGAAIGDTLPGTDLEAFAEAAEAFGAEESINDGLGPTFNERACGNCHTTPVMGGSGEQIERRFGRLTNGVFFGYDSGAENRGGTLRQLFSNGTYQSGDVTCTIGLDTEPASANVRQVGRRTTPLFGLGLIDAMPNSFFDQMAASQPAAVRGLAQRAAITVPDPRDPAQAYGTLRVGRFGWKGQVPTLLVFSADAYLNEMGITTQSCFAGLSLRDFAGENYPDNVPPPAGCGGGDLAPPPPDSPDVPSFTDDAVGDCSGGRTEIQDDVVLFTTFMESLAPPPPDLSDPVSFVLGAFYFGRAGCQTCHTAAVFVTPPRPFNGVPGLYPFQPFSDFLAHDMGALGDRIGQTGDPEAKTRLMRTSPLWGARFNTRFLHDGRATTIREAILAHDGQGAAARNAFAALRNREQEFLIRFVNSI